MAGRGDAEVAVVALEVAEGEVTEEDIAVLANALVGREQHEVGVEPGGLLVEVARAQAGDAADFALVVIGDLADLGVDFETLLTVDHRAAGALETLGPADVVGLVEAGAQLHEDGDVLAVLRCGDERLAELGALCHTIERDLDLDAVVVR